MRRSPGLFVSANPPNTRAVLRSGLEPWVPERGRHMSRAAWTEGGGWWLAAAAATDPKATVQRGNGRQSLFKRS